MKSAFRTTILLFLILTIFLLSISVVVFHSTLKLNWIDSIYFVFTTFTSVGYGDITLYHANNWVKIFGVLLMLLGVAGSAIILAFVTDRIFKLHLDTLMGRRRTSMKDHIVLLGLGAVGTKILEYLVKFDEDVVVVELDEDNTFLSTAKQLRVPVIIGDIRRQATLEEANVEHAKCVIAVTNNDLSNLEAGLNARSMNSDIRIVLRVFDANFAKKIRDGFAIGTAFSTQSLAAPAFAMAGIDPSVVGSFMVGHDLMLNVEIQIKEDSKLSKMTSDELFNQGDYAILGHINWLTQEKQLNPSDDFQLNAGDTLIIATPHCHLQRLHDLNRH